MSAGPRTPMESHEMSTPATAMDDAKEGTRAFGEKRTPQWQAR
jgi:1,4-dihydroxy-2-naphthoyl-CoA synthase